MSEEVVVPDHAKSDYDAYCKCCESLNWEREHITIDELEMSMVSLSSLVAGESGTVVDIVVHRGEKISIQGIQQVPRDANKCVDATKAYPFVLRLANVEDEEIHGSTKIAIVKIMSTESIIHLARLFYADMSNAKYPGVFKCNNELYRFRHGIELNGDQRIRVIAYNPDVNIDIGHITFNFDVDRWIRER